MRKYWLTGVVIGMWLMQACRPKETEKMINDKDFTITAGILNSNNQQGRGLAFKLRLMPAAELKQTAEKGINTDMTYKMDSAFFIQNTKGDKIYPDMLQPVANGVRGSFEYLILFNESLLPVSDSIKLVYQDKFLNHKKYAFTFLK